MTVVYIVVKISIVYVHLSRISTQPYLMKAAADERNRSPRQSSVSARPNVMSLDRWVDAIQRIDSPEYIEILY